MEETDIEQENLSDMDRVADEHNFIVAYPQGIARAKIATYSLPGYRCVRAATSTHLVCMVLRSTVQNALPCSSSSSRSRAHVSS